jgi:hypothetical protein
MQTIALDFARHHHPARAAGWLTFLLGLLALAAVTAADHAYWQPRIAASEQRLHALHQALATRHPAAARIEDTPLLGEWNRAMDVAAELNLPWEKLFAVFESEAERPVALLSFEPDVVKRELVLTGEARNFDAMLAYYRMLQQRENLAAVTLHTHQVNQQDRDKPVRFRITAQWRTGS